MKSSAINIDFKAMAKAIKEAVRKKAALVESSVVYIKDGKLIEEFPQTNTIKILPKEVFL
jgi:hypothetical protein